jgi:hypothetical protein
VLFASDFGQLVPWWFYALFALIVGVPLIAAVIGILAVLIRIVDRLARGNQKPSPDHDSDRTR